MLFVGLLHGSCNRSVSTPIEGTPHPTFSVVLFRDELCKNMGTLYDELLNGQGCGGGGRGEVHAVFRGNGTGLAKIGVIA